MQLRPQWNPGPQVFSINDPNRLYPAHFERNHVFSSKRRFKTPRRFVSISIRSTSFFVKAFSGSNISHWKTRRPPRVGFTQIWTNKNAKVEHSSTLEKWSKPTMDCLLSRIFFSTIWEAILSEMLTSPTGKMGHVLGWPKNSPLCKS